ncbi:IS110 family transposase [Streptomyces sp. NBC_00435]|uniref:transposase n=1 Tax=Streptomyces sp. NBC_00435 TaxID=2903649 RepID=UPI002E241575
MRRRRLREQCDDELAEGIAPELSRRVMKRRGGFSLTAYRTPAAIRRMVARRLEAWLRNRKVGGAAALAVRAVEADQNQMTALRGEELGTELVARSVAAHSDEAAELDGRVETGFRRHQDVVILAMPGMGRTLGTGFVAATGGEPTAFAGPDRLTAFARPAPVLWDSGTVGGYLRGRRRYHRGLQRDRYLSAQVSVLFYPVSRA